MGHCTLPKQMKSEYTKMLSHRRAFLQAGFFKPFLDEIAKQLTANSRILDVGCGEGTPVYQLAQQVPAQYIGFDISKPAIQLASDYNQEGWFCVADLARMPFADQSLDTVLNIFSPSQYQEFKRVLKPDGQLIKSFLMPVICTSYENYYIRVRKGKLRSWSSIDLFV